MNADQLCGLLAEPSRLRVYSALVLGAGTPGEVAERTGLEPAAVAKALQRLGKSDLVVADGNELRADVEVFKEAVRTGRPAREPLSADPERDNVLRAFIRDGRLTHFPTAPAKFKVVLEYLAGSFEPDRQYAEREVNEILQAWNADHATLRRHLVDEGHLNRADGIYTRAN
ncbi:DUF2087 domain-containing protein [Kribbella sp. DT2]|uniref:DUF2087 domain-containing protein n=1 Tax=Kribbella sp. DT2 TaxID=3393427 RepID=UPI003CE9F263